MTELPQADRFADDRTDSPFWNESVWFSYSIPERKIHGLIQYYFRPNMGMLNGGPAMWDPSGTSLYDCLYFNWSNLQALPPGQQKFDMKATNSLAVKVIEPLTRYSINYDNEGFEMDLEWTAIAPLHELETGTADQAATARFHIEQPGRMRGIVRRYGEEFPIDCFSMRDTSYGIRNYTTMTNRGGYFWGIAADSSFHAIAMGEGSEQKVIGGFIWKDGEMSSIVSGTRRVTEYGKHGPRRVTFEAVDKLGRTLNATGELEEGLVFTGYATHTVVWSLIKWQWDGVTHWGDNQEFCPAGIFRRISRGEIALG